MKKIVSLVVVSVVLFCTFGFSAFALSTSVENDYSYVLYPGSFTAIDVVSGFSTRVELPATVPTLMSGDYETMEISSYGTAGSDRDLYKTLGIRHYIGPRSDIDEWGGLPITHILATYISAYGEAPVWFNNSVSGFPLDTWVDMSERYTYPFSDNYHASIEYSTVYVDTESSYLGFNMCFQVRLITNPNLEDTDVLPEVYGQENISDYINEHPMTIEGLVYTVDGYVPFSTTARVSGYINTAYNDVYINYFIMPALRDIVNNMDGVVVSDGLALFTDLKCSVLNVGWSSYTYQFTGFPGIPRVTTLPTMYSYVSPSNSLGNDFSFDHNVTLNPGDFTDWIFDTTGGVLSAEIIPGVALGGLLAIIVGLSLGIWVLKVFAGG